MTIRLMSGSITDNDSVKFGLPVAGTVISITGTLTNLTSLVFFIKKREKTIGDKLLMLLNTLDLLLSLSATVQTVCWSHFIHTLHYRGLDRENVLLYVLRVMTVLYFLLIDGTAYITCLVSVYRAISIIFPFYQIQGKLLVIVGITVFSVIKSFQVALFLAAFKNGQNYWLSHSRIAVSLLVFLTVVLATAVALNKLTRKTALQGITESVSRRNRKATWTAIILSALFLVFNSIFLGVTWNIFENPKSMMLDIYVQTLSFFGFFLAIPLNSSVNPIVYLTRKSDMRHFFVESLSNIRSMINCN